MPRNLNDSCSRQVLRDLSPLGTRMYAAPEVLSGIKDVIQDIDSSCRRRLKRRKSSTNCTTNYGMVAILQRRKYDQVSYLYVQII